jgi:hypothetical protein
MEKRIRKNTGMNEEGRNKDGNEGRQAWRKEGRKEGNMCTITAWYIPCTCCTEFWFAVRAINKSEREGSHSHVDWVWCLVGVSWSIVKPGSSKTRSRWPEW